jgi:hypothetical protein
MLILTAWQGVSKNTGIHFNHNVYGFFNCRWLMNNKDEEEEEVSSYWTAIRKRKSTYIETRSTRFRWEYVMDVT